VNNNTEYVNKTSNKTHQHYNGNKNYNYDKGGYQQQKYSNKYQQKENPNKLFSPISNLIHATLDENKSIKPPTKDYNDIDMNNVYKSKNEAELQRPTFKNSNLAESKTNFKELDTEGDLYLKKLKSNEAVVNDIHYYKRKEKKSRSNKNVNEQEPAEEQICDEVYQDQDQQSPHHKANSPLQNTQDNSNADGDQYYEERQERPYPSYQNKKKYYNKYQPARDIWQLATAPENTEPTSSTNENTYTRPKSMKNTYTSKRDDQYQYNPRGNDNDYYDYSVTKIKSLEFPNRDAVVINVPNAKSIKDLLG